MAIEGNTLSTEQITAILDGKRVIAPPKEITEVRNAIIAYEEMVQWRSTNEMDLLLAHQVLMTGLIEKAGYYRSGGVGVMSGETVVHMAPPANRVQKLMSDLLTWLATTDNHPLIASCVFHYEFEFIHPFADGNGRMGRLWQTLILSQWQAVFSDIPVESLTHQHQESYYLAIRQSTANSDSSPFIEFMLEMILDALSESQSDGVSDGVNKTEAQILKLLLQHPAMTQGRLAQQLDKSKSTVERAIRKLKRLGKIKRVGGDKTGYWEIPNG